MTATMLEVRADIMYDPTHLVSHDVDTGDEIEEPRWVLTIETPDGELTYSAKSAAVLVGVAERWGHGRGVHVTIHFLNPVGGPG